LAEKKECVYTKSLSEITDRVMPKTEHQNTLPRRTK